MARIRYPKTRPEQTVAGKSVARKEALAAKTMPGSKARATGSKSIVAGPSSSKRQVDASDDDEEGGSAAEDSDDPSPDPAEETRLAQLIKAIAGNDKISQKKTDHGTVGDFCPFDLNQVEGAFKTAKLLPYHRKKSTKATQGWVDFDVRAIHRSLGYALFQKRDVSIKSKLVYEDTFYVMRLGVLEKYAAHKIATFLESHEWIRPDDPNFSEGDASLYLPGRHKDHADARYWNNKDDPLWEWDPKSLDADEIRREFVKKPVGWRWEDREEVMA